MMRALQTGLVVRRREYRRWKNAGDRSQGAQLFYGLDSLPQTSDIASGGIIKCMDLAQRWPNKPSQPNLLYLVSSALPPYFPLMIRQLKKRGGRFILNQNGVAYPAWCPDHWQEQNRWLKIAYNEADHIVFQSAFCQQGAERFLGPASAPASILLNPVDSRVFTPTETPPPTEQQARLLLAGSHHFLYRIETALRTVAALRTERPDLQLHIAGRLVWDKDPERCQQQASTLATELGVKDQVSFSGPYSQQEAGTLFRQAGILLHTKYADPCPRLVAEALACGLPVVYSATGGVSELVGPRAGVGVPGPCDWDRTHAPDPEALGRGVLEVLDNYSRYRQAAREQAVQHLDVPAWLDRHAALFERQLAMGAR